jgi:phytoene dehydrogenase-like protein
MSGHDVVIVGAGLAGLRAARILSGRGLDVVLLDAADRPGGRMATDVIDGFRCDRGFQVLNTSYPALRATADLDELRLRTFEPGAAIRGGDGRLHVFAHPLRSPGKLWRTATDGLLSPLAKAKLTRWTAQVLATAPARTAARIDASAAQDFTAAGLDGPVVERLLRPFLSGVLGESALTTSAAFVRLVWRSFALGRIGVPEAGMGALPAQLAARLPAGVLRLGRRVSGLRGPSVLTEDGTLDARAVLVATDPVTAGELLPGLEVPDMHALTTYYHVAPHPPASLPMLHLDATGGPVANSIVLTETAPSYAADGRALISSTVLGGADRLTEAAVRAELARLYAVPTAHWEHLHTAEVPRALPSFRAGWPLRRPVELTDGIFVAGDHRDTPSSQGALVSGRRAAEAVAAALGAPAPAS